MHLSFHHAAAWLRCPATWLGLLLLSLAGCRQTPAALPVSLELALPPSLGFQVEHHFGTLLGGSTGPPGLGTAEPASHRLRLRFLSLERLPSAGWAPLAEHTRLVAAPAGVEPIRGATRFAMGAGFAQGEAALDLWDQLHGGAAGRTILAHEFEGALLQGSSCRVSLEAVELVMDPDNFLGEWPDRGPVKKRLSLGVEWRREGALGIGVGYSDLAPGEPQLPGVPPAEGGRPDGEFLQHEWLVPELLPELDGGPVVLVLPSPFDSGEGAAYALWVEILSVSAELQESHAKAHQVALKQAQASVQAAQDMERSASREELLQRSVWRAFQGLEASKEERELRALLMYLAGEGGARLAADLALVADHKVLRAWVTVLLEKEHEAPATVNAVGWLLERAAWQYLSQTAMRGDLALWLDALLLRHAGEVGRYPSSLSEEARRAPSAAAMGERLLAENLLFLEDSSTSARVRAFDWLRRRGAEPGGFDPLANKLDRRAALARSGEAVSESNQE